jgi:hypothetical protein
VVGVLGGISWIIGDAHTLDLFRHIVVILVEFQQIDGMDQGRTSPVVRVEPVWMRSGSMKLRSVVVMFD